MEEEQFFLLPIDPDQVSGEERGLTNPRHKENLVLLLVAKRTTIVSPRQKRGVEKHVRTCWRTESPGGWEAPPIQFIFCFFAMSTREMEQRSRARRRVSRRLRMCVCVGVRAYACAYAGVCVCVCVCVCLRLVRPHTHTWACVCAYMLYAYAYVRLVGFWVCVGGY